MKIQASITSYPLGSKEEQTNIKIHKGYVLRTVNNSTPKNLVRLMLMKCNKRKQTIHKYFLKNVIVLIKGNHD